MASGSRDPEIREVSLDLSGNRKRAHEEDAEGDIQETKKRHILFEHADHDDNDKSLDSDIEALLNEADDDDDAEEVDHEPKQGPVLWSEGLEQYPPCAIYHADVKRHQARITELTVDITHTLSKIRQEGDDIAKLHAEAVACQKFPEPKKMVVALIGDAGSGKSSLINSVLDIPHVSQEGNFGSAVTCAITEFSSAFPEQTKKFAAKVQFLDPNQRRKLLKDHLDEYIYYHFEKDSLSWTREEEKEHYAQAQTAECTFLDLFRGKPSFSSHKVLKSYINIARVNGTEDEVSAQMEMWCDELIAAHTSSSPLVVETDVAFRLRGPLNPFLSSSDSLSREPRLWPMVFKVSVGIKGARVLQNLVLADMPGLTDISRVRVKASKNYMRSSDYMWIVVPVMRCVSDSGVDSILYEFGERFKGRLAMICTKIDDSMRSGAFKARYEHARKKLEKIEKLLEVAQSTGNGADEEKFANYRLKLMVQTRNQMVAKEIYEKRSEYFGREQNCPVFFVSNEHYTWLKGYRESNTRQTSTQLDAAATGIPSFRRYALSISAQEMWSIYMAHVQHTIIALMKGLAIWAARTSADHGSELKRIKEKSKEDIDRSVAIYVRAVDNDALHSLAGTMRENLDRVAQKGYEYLQNVVRALYWNTIKAVIKRRGTFNSSAHGLIDWNEKFKQPAMPPLSTEWDRLFSRERQHMATAEKRIKDDLDALHFNLEEMTRLYNIPKEHFVELIDAQKHGVTRAVQIYSGNMDKELKNTRQLTENDERFGYFAQVIKPVYKEAALITGTGYKNKVLTLFENFINKRDQTSPFIRMTDYASNRVTEHATNFTEELHKECNKIYDAVFDQFGGLMTENEVDNANVAAVKTALREYLPKVDAEMNEIVSKLKAIEKDPRPDAKRKTIKPDSDMIKREEKQRDNAVKAETEPKTKIKIEIKQEQN